MIAIVFNKRDFEYDVYSLVKAFFPEEKVEVFTEQEQSTGDVTLRVSVFYEKTQTSVRLSVGPRVIVEKGDAIIECSRGLTEQMPRPQRKNVLKDVLYRALCQYTGQHLPWGDLTGIRPTKLPMAMLKEGKRDEEILTFLETAHHVSPSRSRLALTVARREQQMINDLDTSSWSLYLGIPFCPSICLYCTFSSGLLDRWQSRVEDYLDALCHEMDETATLFRERKLISVYMGGGTPTTLTAAQLNRILTHLEETFDLRDVREFTVEAGRPDTITREKLVVLKAHGVNRISINPQSMNQKTLDRIGRNHTVEEIRETFHLARTTGFEDINMDLIVGLPGEGIDEVRHTMDEIARLSPDNLTVHSLALKRASRLNQMIEQYRPVSFASSTELMDMTMAQAESQGLKPYYMYRQKNMAGNFENIGYAKEGKEGLYNILIMEEIHSIAALGAGTVSKRVDPDGRIERCDNVKDIGLYIERIDDMITRKQHLYQGIEGGREHG